MHIGLSCCGSDDSGGLVRTSGSASETGPLAAVMASGGQFAAHMAN
jgi:hypothetical protein